MSAMDGETIVARAEVLAEMLIREVAHHDCDPQDVLVMAEVAQELVRRVFMPFDDRGKYDVAQVRVVFEDGQLEWQ